MSQRASGEREAQRLQLEALELQLEAEDKQVEADAKKVEAARAQMRVDQLRMPENAGFGHGNNSTAPTTGPTIPVRGLPSNGRQNDPQSPFASTAGRSGRGSFGGVTKRRPQATIPGENRGYTTGSGTKAGRLLSIGLGHGHRDRSTTSAQTPIGVSSQAQLPRKEQMSFLSDKVRSLKVTDSSGRTPREERVLDRPIELVASERGACCIICRRPHVMKDCLGASRGYILGCTLCNTRDHAVDTCSQFVDLSVEEKAKVVVYERGNRPMLQTTQHPWHYYLKEYLKEAGQDAAPTAFPWTKKFAQGVHDRDDFANIQDAWDKDKDVSALPKDPAHDSLGAVRLLYWSDRI